jgi:Protein of unknown function (DUF2637)
MSDMSTHARTGPDSWQKAAIGGTVIVTVVLVLLAYGIAGSYESLSHLAVANHVPLPRFAPVGLDGGLIGVISLDITLTWTGRSIGWLRQTARLFALGTVAANAWAGWPDPVGVFMRIFAPLLIVIISEALRTVLLRKARGTDDPVPAARWLLAPWPTFRLWRRMKLWQIASYSAAVDMELSRLHAIAKLADRYGADWRKDAPGVLAWMLTAGVRMDDALAMVTELTTPPAAEVQPVRSGVNKTRRSGSKTSSKSGRPARVPSVPLDPELASLGTEAAAYLIMERERGISGPQLADRLGVSESYGCRLKKKLTADAPVTGPIERVQ